MLTLCTAAVVALAMSGSAHAAPPDRQAPNVPTDMTSFTDFDRLDRPSSPNTWLVAPAESVHSLHADAAAPEFEYRAVRLTEDWIRVLEQQPRTEIIAVSDDGLQVEAEQRSAVFRFVDRISFRAVPLGPGRSTFFAYSRSELGYWDLGVNRRRLDDWLAALQTLAGGATP